MYNDNEVRDRILLKSEEMFNTFGYSRITMDEIARELAISKKTLYKHFSNKEHILKTIVENRKCEIHAFMEKMLSDKNLEFLEKLKGIMNFFTERVRHLNGLLMQDLIRNHPEIWRSIKESTQAKAYKNFGNFIEQGVKSGVFRNDVDPAVVVVIFFAAINSLMNPEVLASLPVAAENIRLCVYKIVFEGILTDSGRKKYNNIITATENHGVYIDE